VGKEHDMNFSQFNGVRWMVAACLCTVACGGSGGQSDGPGQAGVGGGGGPSASTPAGLPDRNEKLTALPAIDPSLGFQVDEGEFTVPPGADITYCVRIPIPAEYVGKDVALLGWDWDLPKYTHHFFMSYSTAPFTGTEVTPCDGANPVVYNNGVTPTEPGAIASSLATNPTPNGLSAIGEGKLVFGAGVGVDRYMGTEQYGRILGTGGHLVTNHHVLNTSTEPVKMHGRFNMYVKDATLVAHPTNEFNCLSLDVNIDPLSERVVTATCTAPFDLDLVLMASHAHNHLTKFEERFFDGQQTQPDLVYSSDVWNSPELVWHDQPLHLKKGQGLTFSCYYKNTGDTQVTFGTNVQNEMCATMNAYAMPADQEFAPTPPLGTLISDNAKNTCLTIDKNNQVTTAPDCNVQDTTKSPIPFF
jgi:hypothetical protein